MPHCTQTSRSLISFFLFLAVAPGLRAQVIAQKAQPHESPASGSPFIYIGFIDSVRQEVKEGQLTPQAKAFYLHELESAAGIAPTDKMEILTYHFTGNVMKVRVPDGRAEAIRQILEKDKLPFVKFIDVPSQAGNAKSK